jgi:hypothetical protein
MILRRIDGSRFSEVASLWGGLTAVILGGGPSLAREQVEMVRGAREAGTVRVIAVNDSYLLAPWADVQYAADEHWRKWHADGIDKPLLGLTAQDVRERWAGFPGQKGGIQSQYPCQDDAVHLLRNRDFPAITIGLSMDPGALVTGRNSGFQALNLAILAGAKRVILLGFDGKPNAEGREHFHGGHPKPTPAAAYPLYRQAMSAAENAIKAAGVTVLNCSPGSAIDSFPKADLEDAL